MNRPWFKFFAGDWLQDPGLRLCSLAAQGLCVRVMCLMHQARPYGHLVVAGKPLDKSELCRVLGEEPCVLEPLLRELEDQEIFARSSEGLLLCPRLIEQHDEHERAVANGKLGGHPGLNRTPKAGAKPPRKPSPRGSPGREDKPPDNAGDNPRDNTQKSEVRDQSVSDAEASEVSDEHDEEEVSLHVEARRIWCDLFEQVTGEAYAYSGAADGKQINRLLERPDFTVDELRRRAGRFLQDPFWAEQGVDLKRFVSQWTALGNAGRKVGQEPESHGPSPVERAWLLKALAEEPGSPVREHALRSLKAWDITEDQLRGMAP